MFTRSDYLENKCTHSEYYGQFVNQLIKNSLVVRFTEEGLIEAYKQDEHFNNIPLNKWGYYSNHKKFEEFGDFYSPAGAVCIEKEAALQIVAESNNIMVNGYKIRFNSMWDEWQVSHEDIGANLFLSKNFNHCKEFAEKG